jgi:hypothetical protein
MLARRCVWLKKLACCGQVADLIDSGKLFLRHQNRKNRTQDYLQSVAIWSKFAVSLTYRLKLHRFFCNHFPKLINLPAFFRLANQSLIFKRGKY